MQDKSMEPSPIRAARKQAGLRQIDVAADLGVDISSVSGWETGRFRPDPANAVRLTQLMPGLTLDAIYSQAEAA